MERPPSTSRGKTVQRPVSVACGDGLKLTLPWTTKRNNNRSRYVVNRRGSASICDATAPFCPQVAKHPRPTRVGVFKYDALCYARNFDDGALDGEDEECFSHGFSSRYAAPASKSSSSSSSTRG